MRVFGIEFFKRTSDPRCINIASFHSPHSLTWRWGVSLRFPVKGCGRWIGAYRSAHNCGCQMGLQIAKFDICLSTQKPMWYRDVYQRLRDEQDMCSGMMWKPGMPEPAPEPIEPRGAIH